MNQLPGGNIRPIITIQPLPRQKRRAWWPWVVALLVVILALVSQIPVRTYYTRGHAVYADRWDETPLIVWAIEHCYIIDPFGK